MAESKAICPSEFQVEERSWVCCVLERGHEGMHQGSADEGPVPVMWNTEAEYGPGISRVRKDFEIVTALVRKLGGEVSLSERELINACGLVLHRYDHPDRFKGISFKVEEAAARNTWAGGWGDPPVEPVVPPEPAKLGGLLSDIAQKFFALLRATTHQGYFDKSEDAERRRALAMLESCLDGETSPFVGYGEIDLPAAVIALGELAGAVEDACSAFGAKRGRPDYARALMVGLAKYRQQPAEEMRELAEEVLANKTRSHVGAAATLARYILGK